MNVFSKYELISGAAAELHTVASRLRLKFFFIFELYSLLTIGDQALIIIKQIINPQKVIKRVFVSKTPNACRDGDKSTTARLNKQ